METAVTGDMLPPRFLEVPLNSGYITQMAPFVTNNGVKEGLYVNRLDSL